MPINFEPAAPVAPNLSAAGGRADVMTHDFGALAGMYQHYASLRQQMALANQHAALQSAAMQQQAGQANAAMQSQERERANALQEQSVEFAGQQSYRQAEMEQQAQQVQFQAEQRQQVMQLDAQLQQQALSQQEQSEKAQLLDGYARVKADPTLEDKDKLAIMSMMSPKISAFMAREAYVKQKATKEMTDLHAAQRKTLETENQAAVDLAAASASNQFTYKTLPQAEAAIADEVDTAYPELAQKNPKARQDMIDRLAKERGQVLQYYQSGGKTVPAVDHNKMVVASHDARLQVRQDQRMELTAEQHTKNMREIDHDVDAWAAKQDKPPSEAEKDAERRRRMDRYKKGLDELRDHGKTKEAEVGAQAKAGVDNLMRELDSPLVRPDIKQAGMQILARAKGYLERYGSPAAMPPEVRKVYSGLQNAARNIQSMIPQPPPAAAGGGVGSATAAALTPQQEDVLQTMKRKGYSEAFLQETIANWQKYNASKGQ